MSSTNRGKRKKLLENYKTLEWPVNRLLDRVGEELPTGKGARWLEPCASDGDIITTIKKRYPLIRWSAIEVDPNKRRGLRKIVPKTRLKIGNYFDQRINTRYDVIITNPPYSIAYEVVQKSLLYADWVIVLLSVNWFGSRKRHGFLSQNAPDLYVLPNRPSFTNDGNTDSNEYAWYVWPPTSVRVMTWYGYIELLDLTPLAERRVRAESL